MHVLVFWGLNLVRDEGYDDIVRNPRGREAGEKSDYIMLMKQF